MRSGVIADNVHTQREKSARDAPCGDDDVRRRLVSPLTAFTMGKRAAVGSSDPGKLALTGQGDP